jgi:hypothetical protein
LKNGRADLPTVEWRLLVAVMVIEVLTTEAMVMAHSVVVMTTTIAEAMEIVHAALASTLRSALTATIEISRVNSAEVIARAVIHRVRSITSLADSDMRIPTVRHLAISTQLMSTIIAVVIAKAVTTEARVTDSVLMAIARADITSVQEITILTRNIA